MRLIDADALIIKLKEESSSLYAQTLYAANNGIKIAMQLVDDAHTIDQVKHGIWQMNVDSEGEYGCCSVCGCPTDMAHDGQDKHEYCSRCGARMDGDEDAVD